MFVLAIFYGTLNKPRPIGFAGEMSATTSLQILEGRKSSDWRSRLITDRDLIQRILSAMSYEHIDHQPCPNASILVIEQDRSNYRIRFCAHSYLVDTSWSSKPNRMTPGFLKALQDAVKNDKRHWNLSDWQAPEP
jgi:hypothetical protein